jgi:hypothetical protein
MQPKKKHGPGKGSVYKPGVKSREPFITVNEKYGRIYFSANAAKIFDLENKGFVIFQYKGNWFFKVSKSPEALKLIFHQYAYYIVDRELVTRLLAGFPGEKPLRLNIEGAELKAKKYLLTKRDSGVPSKARKKKKGGGSSSVTPAPVVIKDTPVQNEVKKVNSAQDEMTREALNKIASYERTNFQGRIKTLEVIRAERIINAKR